MTRWAGLSNRFKPYWRMELACAALFPPLAFFIATPTDLLSLIVLAFALAICCSILLIGGAYWRAVLLRLQGEPGAMQAVLRVAARSQSILGVLSVVSLVLSLCVLSAKGMQPALLAGLIFATLSVLEYVNYFHVQLQNFDHGPTLRRFLKERRFRRAHMARELRRLRGGSGSFPLHRPSAGPRLRA